MRRIALFLALTIGLAGCPSPPLGNLDDLAPAADLVAIPIDQATPVSDLTADPNADLTALPDLVSVPDLASTPDLVSAPIDLLVVPDLTTAGPDLTTAGPDLTTVAPDLATVGPDLATVAPDLATGVPDLATVGPDLTTAVPDLAVVPDLAMVVPDLAVVLDLLPPADLAPRPNVVVFVPGAVATTFSGDATWGNTNGALADARFRNPVGIVRHGSTLYVTEYDANRVRKLDAGMVSTVTVTPQSGALFIGPYGITVSDDGNLFVQTDFDRLGMKTSTSGTIWSINLTTGTTFPYVANQGRPRGIFQLADGNVAVSDRLRAVVSILTPSPPAFTFLAGGDGQIPPDGWDDGDGIAARFAAPHGIIELPDGDLLLADSSNHCLRRITRGGHVTTYAGAYHDSRTVDGTLTEARFVEPRGLAIDDTGTIFVADVGAKRVRRIFATGPGPTDVVVQTVAGDGTAGFVDGAGSVARFYGLEGIAASADGKTLWVTDGNLGDETDHHRIRRITLP